MFSARIITTLNGHLVVLVVRRIAVSADIGTAKGLSSLAIAPPTIISAIGVFGVGRDVDLAVDQRRTALSVKPGRRYDFGSGLLIEGNLLMTVA